jgi:hypothetical protein
MDTRSMPGSPSYTTDDESDIFLIFKAVRIMGSIKAVVSDENRKRQQPAARRTRLQHADSGAYDA